MKRLVVALMLMIAAPASAQTWTVPISGLPAATMPLSGSELVPIVQSGVTKRTTVSSFASGTSSGFGADCTPNTGSVQNCFFYGTFGTPLATGGVGLQGFLYDGSMSTVSHYGISIFEVFKPSAQPSTLQFLSPDGILGTFWGENSVDFCVTGGGSGCTGNINIGLGTGVFGQTYQWSQSSGLGLITDYNAGIVGAAQLGDGAGTGQGTLNNAVAISADLLDSDYGGDGTTKGQIKNAIGVEITASPCDNFGRSMGALAGKCYGILFDGYYNDPLHVQTGLNAPNGGSIAAVGGMPITITNNGTETARFDANNNLDVGANTSQTDASIWVFRQVAGADRRILMQNNATTTGTQARLDLQTGSTNAFAEVAQSDGATPQFQILTGAGDTGGIFLNPTAGGITVAGVGTVGSTQNFLCVTSLGLVQQGTSCVVSARRYKQNILPLHHGLDWLMKFRPVTYNEKVGRRPMVGLVAEDVEDVDERLAAYNKDGTVQGIQEEAIVGVLVKAVQDQQKEIADLRAQITTLAKKALH